MGDYYNNQEAKVNIMSVLVERGWKVYGYKPDESDSMTDYWSPSHWDGIAEKNGFVLVIDNHSTAHSGHQKKKYNYNNRINVSNERIKKLEAMMNDIASTDNEKASCAALIEKEREKAGLQTEYIVLETYPIFSHGNPKKCSWHIERDGQLLAKGTGVYSCYVSNDYIHENRIERDVKINALVARFEAVVSNSDALKAEVVKVPKQVIKPVQKADNTINKGDILSFTYHGHYWIVLDVYTVGEQVRVTYESLGSEKRGYKRVNNSKRYYQPLTRLQKRNGRRESKSLHSARSNSL